ncbi:MAG TPA: glycosyltransferase, partial [Kribbella sp.]|nr:glycosyltransferase [Kribbella sp.]
MSADPVPNPAPDDKAAPFERAVACVIPAKDEADRIAATVDAVHKIIGVDLVVVVDDGSTDRTAEVAEQAGAVVVRHERNRGKAAAMETGAAA